MAEIFKLPISSYEEIVKIIKAYSTGKVGQPMTLDELSQTSSIYSTSISANNGFLLELGLISEGKAKSPTEICIKLGRAYSHNIVEDVISSWKEIIEGNDFLNRMISAIKIRNGMDKSNFINHIIYSSGLDSNTKYKTGAGAVIEILKCADIVEDNDGKITAKITENKTITIISPIDDKQIPEQNETIGQKIINKPFNNNSNNYQIIININLNGTVDDLDKLSSKIKNFLNDFSK